MAVLAFPWLSGAASPGQQVHAGHPWGGLEPSWMQDPWTVFGLELVELSAYTLDTGTHRFWHLASLKQREGRTEGPCIERGWQAVLAQAPACLSRPADALRGT